MTFADAFGITSAETKVHPQSPLSQFETALRSMDDIRAEASARPSGAGVKGVSLVIPAYNEANRITRTLDAYLPILEALKVPFEVIVVVDGHDGTPEAISPYSSRNVTGVRASQKLGKGGAILFGFGRSKYDVVGYVDADGSLNGDDLLKLIEETSNADCVIASRWIPGSRWIHREPALKCAFSRGFNMMVRGLLNLQFFDTQCGAKFYKSELLKRVVAGVTVTNLTIDVALLYHLKESGASIREVPVSWEDMKGSRFKLGKMTLAMFVTVLGIRVMNTSLSRFVPRWAISVYQSKLGNI